MLTQIWNKYRIDIIILIIAVIGISFFMCSKKPKPDNTVNAIIAIKEKEKIEAIKKADLLNTEKIDLQAKLDAKAKTEASLKGQIATLRVKLGASQDVSEPIASLPADTEGVSTLKTLINKQISYIGELESDVDLYKQKDLKSSMREAELEGALKISNEQINMLQMQNNTRIAYGKSEYWRGFRHGAIAGTTVTAGASIYFKLRF